MEEQLPTEKFLTKVASINRSVIISLLIVVKMVDGNGTV